MMYAMLRAATLCSAALLASPPALATPPSAIAATPPTLEELFLQHYDQGYDDATTPRDSRVSR